MAKRLIFPFPRKFKPYAVSIRAVCLQWSMLESSVDWLFETLSTVKKVKKFQTISHNIDFREKLQIILGLAHLRRRKKLFQVTKWCIDQIDNDLRVRRNRFVHDLWQLKPKDGTLRGAKLATMERIQHSTGFRKKPRQIEYYTFKTGSESPTEVMALCNEIHRMGLRLNILRFAYGGANEGGCLTMLQYSAPLSPPEAKRFGLPPEDDALIQRLRVEVPPQ
ncbi:MAG: hypothetical protein KGL11_13195 [Alphaproteobacteria bacterium]|nr:hypothetical protein [Alphaproteobacteria bacterium]